MVNYYKKVQPFLALSDEYIQAEFFLVWLLSVALQVKKSVFS
jgi:hypothetical protein